MIELKDYLHLYIGCYLVIDDDIQDTNHKLIGVVAGFDCYLLHGIHNQYGHCDISKVKPILRPLSSMAEKEAIEIAIIMHGQPDSVKWRMEDKGKYFNVYRKHYHLSFTIDKASGDIDRYDKEGDQFELQTTLQHHYITHYMLSKHFDLFGLIESGLAIDADCITY